MASVQIHHFLDIRQPGCSCISKLPPKSMLVGRRQGFLDIVDSTTLKLRKRFVPSTPTKEVVAALALSKNPYNANYAISLSLDAFLILWNIPLEAIEDSLKLTTRYTYCMMMHNDKILVGGSDGCVTEILLEVNNHAGRNGGPSLRLVKLRQVYKLSGDVQITCLCAGESGQIYVGTSDGRLVEFDAQSGFHTYTVRVVQKITGSKRQKLEEKNLQEALRHAPSDVNVFNFADELLDMTSKIFPNGSCEIYSILSICSLQNESIAMGDSCGRIYLVDGETRTVLKEMNIQHNAPVKQIVGGKNCFYVATLSGKVLKFETQNGNWAQVISRQVFFDECVGLVAEPQGNTIIAGGNGTLRLFTSEDFLTVGNPGVYSLANYAIPFLPECLGPHNLILEHRHTFEVTVWGLVYESSHVKLQAQIYKLARSKLSNSGAQSLNKVQSFRNSSWAHVKLATIRTKYPIKWAKICYWDDESFICWICLSTNENKLVRVDLQKLIVEEPDLKNILEWANECKTVKSLWSMSQHGIISHTTVEKNDHWSFEITAHLSRVDFVMDRVDQIYSGRHAEIVDIQIMNDQFLVAGGVTGVLRYGKEDKLRIHKNLTACLMCKYYWAAPDILLQVVANSNELILIDLEEDKKKCFQVPNVMKNIISVSTIPDSHDLVVITSTTSSLLSVCQRNLIVKQTKLSFIKDVRYVQCVAQNSRQTLLFTAQLGEQDAAIYNAPLYGTK